MVHAIHLAPDAGAAEFRDAARRCLALGLSPHDVAFSAEAEPSRTAAPAPAAPIRVPRAYAVLLEDAVCHRAADRFGLLYDVLWRIQAGERDLASRADDPVVARLAAYAAAVRDDIRRMRASLSFVQRHVEGRPVAVAWFEPHHWILARALPFFVGDRAGTDWLIATPVGSARLLDGALTFGPAVPRPDGADGDRLEALWSACDRPAAPAESVDAIAALRREARTCTRCPLYAPATQTVFGEGPPNAPVVFVGEQPGDQEDRAGRPFVGPAGQMFDRALVEAGVDRARVYVTNAVKHFKFEPRGKRRIHMKPNGGEVEACRWWVEREIGAIAPQLVVALGATAALSLTGRALAVTRVRGQRLALLGRPGLVTVHPSYLLRIQEEVAAADEYARFVADLRLVAEWVAAVRPG